MFGYNWGGFDMRWELEALSGGTSLTQWTNVGRRFISMGAAGWHIVSMCWIGFWPVSREYSRFFGQPPMRDIKTLRDGKVEAIDAA
jgi:hypothetical protein